MVLPASLSACDFPRRTIPAFVELPYYDSPTASLHALPLGVLRLVTHLKKNMYLCTFNFIPISR